MRNLLVVNQTVISFSSVFLFIFKIKLGWIVNWWLGEWGCNIIGVWIFLRIKQFFGWLLVILNSWENFTPNIMPFTRDNHLKECIHLNKFLHLLRSTSYSVLHIPRNNQNTHLWRICKWSLTVITVGTTNWLFYWFLGLWAIWKYCSSLFWNLNWYLSFLNPLSPWVYIYVTKHNTKNEFEQRNNMLLRWNIPSRLSYFLV